MWHTWNDLDRCFVQQFYFNIDILSYHTSLSKLRKKTTKSFREYAIRWRKQVATVKTPMKESEMIDVFSPSSRTRMLWLLSFHCWKTFTKDINVGEMVKTDIKTGKDCNWRFFESQDRTDKKWIGMFSRQEIKKDVANIVSRTQNILRGPFYPYAQSPIHHYHAMQNHNTLFSHLNTQSVVHNHVDSHQTVLNGERQNIKPFSFSKILSTI